MGKNGELDIDKTLFDALTEVWGEAPTAVSPMVVLAAYLYSLKDGYGLTDTQHLDADKVELPPIADDARRFIDQFIPGSADMDSLRNFIYGVFASMSADANIRRRINKSNRLSDTEVLMLGQIAWNLEQNERRRRLPLGPRPIRRNGKPFTLDIPVPKRDLDFATMRWTERRNLTGVPGKSSGASFGSQAARLAVLAAKWLLDAGTPPTPEIGEASLVDGAKGTQRIVWAAGSAQEPTIASTGFLPADSKALGLSAVPRTGRIGPVLVGDFAEVGDRYQRRGFDDEITRVWEDGGDRRVWLCGGPGLGKSYAARKVMQSALGRVDDNRHDLLIWVNSADSVTVTREFSRAAERLDLGDSVSTDAADRADLLTRSLLEHLRTTDERWLIVLDDADAEGLIENNLVPTGTNPRGRVLITTLSGSHRIVGAGRHVEAELFSRGEAEDFIKNRLPETSEDDRAGLSKIVRHHPLALSIAASTIAANGMTVTAWIEEFEHARRMDEAADFADVGGYPRLVGATWQLALDRASRRMPEGVVQRAAMVAALQDPDGHPTWLWQRDPVREWVAGGADLPWNRGRMHPGIKRLVDYGIIRLVGDWPDGRITIHQLAARAIRESAAPETLAELGALLADQWLLELTLKPANTQSKEIRAGVAPVAAIPYLSSSARNTATALLNFSQPSSSEQVLGSDHFELELLRPHLSQGGAIGQAAFALRLADVGLDEQALGRHVDAQRNLAEAAAIYRRLIDTPDLPDDLRAGHFEALAEIDAELNRPDQAHNNRTNAARLRERFKSSEVMKVKSIANQLALADLYEKLSDPQGTKAALDRALSLWDGQESADPDADASTYAGLARRLTSAGRLAEAEEHMRRAAELYETTKFGRTVRFKQIATELGYICARAGKWTEAEEWFLRSESNPVPLASVLLRQGRSSDARATLAQAARSSEAVTQREPSIDALIREMVENSVVPTLYSLVQKAMGHGRWEEAADLATVCLELTRARHDLNPGEDPQKLAQAYFTAGVASRSAVRLDTAITHFTSSADILEMLIQISRTEDLQLKYGQSLYWLATTTQDTGSPESAANHARRAVEILSQLDSEEARQDLSDALSVLGLAYLEKGDADEAIASFTYQVRIWQAAYERAPASNTAISFTKALEKQWLALMKTRRWNEAVQPLIDAIAIYRTMPPADTQDGEALAGALFNLAYVYFNQGGSASESASFAEQSVGAWQELLDEEPSNLGLQVSIAYALYMLAASLSELDRDLDVVSVLNRAANHLQLPTELRPDDLGPLLMEVLTELESGLRAIGDDSYADEIRARANDLARRLPPLTDEE
ncbi:tetratricopeptide repeat protein [Arthrobacter jiangjiafuii]|uniref:Tetratricopeptide repeat protein n=1 Tax=Arthrobacter jiangjiafuii TaxID=2817475 RepID=A0A975R2E8_9MICC|nr:tetratricopeptide repeat protein [Arthrobacter jiangjiafuii]MBP3043003.1 tetratricopeptide repeat protein [Arthrobacter jiangjiafuii]QWC11523.1 tetratricopeptide repeat protein [Arthrobacter jiangjiafuii]